MDIVDVLSTERYVSGQQLAEALDISRAAVHKRIGKLRAQGYVIRGEKRLGYTLVARPDVLSPAAVRRHLPEAPVLGGTLVHHPETVSTQTTARELAEAGAPEGTVVVAERQGSPYGRMRRAWLAPPGGLWFSVILRPAVPPEKVLSIAQVVSVALCRAVEKVVPGVPLAIKWPNDVMTDLRKLAGIIVEMSAEVGRVNWVVAGIGLNVNNPVPGPVEHIAASLADRAGGPVDRSLLLAVILSELGAAYERFSSEGFAAFVDEYDRRSLLAGMTVTVSEAGESVTGTVRGVDAEGRLLLDDGTRLHRILAGDATIRKDGRCAAEGGT